MRMKHFLAFVFTLLLCGGLLTISAQAASTVSAPEISVSNVASSGKIKLSWDPVDGAKTYSVYRSTDKNGTYKKIYSTSSTSFTNQSVEAGDKYYYYIKALNSKGKASAASNKVYATCKLPRPSVTLENSVYSGKITISWNAVKGAKNYLIYRSTSKNGTYTCIKNTTGTSHVNASTTAGKTYYYKVKAIAPVSAANSAYSSVKYRICDLARPTIELSNTASSGKIKVSWKAIEGASGYKLYRSPDKKNWDFIASTTATSKTDTTAKPGETYYYRLQAAAEKSSADSSYSNVLYRTCDLPRPQLEVTNDEITGRVKLTWAPIDGAVRYKIYRTDSENGTYDYFTATTKTSYTDNSAETGVTYYYKVTAAAENAGADSAKSTAASGTFAPVETLQPRYVKASRIVLYEEPTSTAPSIMLRYMEPVELGLTISSSDAGTWSRVFSGGNLYYMWQNAGEEKLTETKSSFEFYGNTPLQQEIIDLAMDICNNWDTVYEYYQSNGVQKPDGSYGFVCSGYVKYVYNTIMSQYVPTYKISSDIAALSTTESVYNSGYPNEFVAYDVPLDELQPGDVLFFKLDANDTQATEISHCGIYLTEDEFVHCTDSWEDSVCVMPLSDIYTDTLVSALRFLPDTIAPANTICYAYNPETNYRNYTVYTDSEKTVKETVPSGTELRVLYTDNGNWVYAQLEDGRTVYVHVSNVSRTNPNP